MSILFPSSIFVAPYDSERWGPEWSCRKRTWSVSLSTDWTRIGCDFIPSDAWKRSGRLLPGVARSRRSRRSHRKEGRIGDRWEDRRLSVMVWSTTEETRISTLSSNKTGKAEIRARSTYLQDFWPKLIRTPTIPYTMPISSFERSLLTTRCFIVFHTISPLSQIKRQHINRYYLKR